jgi:hypothetical protein
VLHEHHIIYSFQYYPRFHVRAVGLRTYYSWIRGHYCTVHQRSVRRWLWKIVFWRVTPYSLVGFGRAFCLHLQGRISNVHRIWMKCVCVNCWSMHARIHDFVSRKTGLYDSKAIHIFTDCYFVIRDMTKATRCDSELAVCVCWSAYQYCGVHSPLSEGQFTRCFGSWPCSYQQ